jgi:hypothetical protein
MSFRSITEVLCITAASAAFIGCAAGEANSPPDDGNGGAAGSSIMNNNGAGGGSFIQTGAGGSSTLPPGGGQTGSNTGGYQTIPPLGTGGSSQPSGNGGTPGAAGSPPSNAGGATGTPGSQTIEPANLIDDLEDNDGSIKDLGGRHGAWYTYNDQTAGGTQIPAMADSFTPSACGYMSSNCAHTNGSGFKTWGAGYGFDLNNDGTTKGTYDVSAFTGIAFYAKGTSFRLKVLTTATVPSTEGGACTGTKCGDNFGTPITATADYQQFVVPFSSLTQEKWGTPATFDPKTVIGVQFQVGMGVTFDISIDDVGLY